MWSKHGNKADAVCGETRQVTFAGKTQARQKGIDKCVNSARATSGACGPRVDVMKLVLGETVYGTIHTRNTNATFLLNGYTPLRLAS